MKSGINKKYLLLSFIAALLLQLAAFQFASAQKTNTTKKDSAIFNFKSSEQTWVVPQNVSVVHIEAWGAQGGGTQGGKGGKVNSDLKVTPGAKLFINVGSQGVSAAGGYNGGGNGCGKGFGGGGATDIRVGGSGLENRVLVAGGGGGVGYLGFGGAGGGLEGGAGKYDDKETSKDHIAKGGTQTEGGNGARAYYSKAGVAGTGGEGINNRNECSNNAMGGGGGGYFGGGASGGGGGGGGNSYTSNANSNVKHEQGTVEGNGKLSIYWDVK